MQSTKPTTFQIELGVLGASKVEVGGIDLTDAVEQVVVIAGDGEVPRVRLQLARATDPQRLAGTGIVEVVVEHPDDLETIAAFLSNIDPDELSKEVLNRDGNSPPMAAALEVLTEMALGRA